MPDVNGVATRLPDSIAVSGESITAEKHNLTQADNIGMLNGRVQRDGTTPFTAAQAGVAGTAGNHFVIKSQVATSVAGRTGDVVLSTADISGSSRFRHIQRVDFTGQTQLAITQLQPYDNIILHINDLTLSQAGSPILQLLDSNLAGIGSGYVQYTINGDTGLSPSVPQSDLDINNNGGFLFGSVTDATNANVIAGSPSGQRFTADLKLMNFGNPTMTHLHGTAAFSDPSGFARFIITGGIHEQAVSAYGLRLVSTSGTMSGRIMVHGTLRG